MSRSERWTFRRLFTILGMGLLVWAVTLVVLFVTAAVVSIVVSNF